MKTSSKGKLFSVPDSCIRPPGGLLLEKKYSLSSKTSGVAPDSWEAQDTTQESCSIEDEGFHSFDSVFWNHSIDEVAAPGKLKHESDDLSILIKSTKLALSKHNMTLSLEVFGKQFKEIFSILKVISAEVSLFPVGFFQKINLKQLVISQEGDVKKISNTFSLQTDVLDNDVKIEERFYKIIFDHLTSAKSEISRYWYENLNSISCPEIRETMEIWSLEEIFIALMKNRTHPLLKHLMANLRELLTEHFPEDLTEKWFETRSQIKKRTRRVSFTEKKFVSM